MKDESTEAQAERQLATSSHGQPEAEQILSYP